MRRETALKLIERKLSEGLSQKEVFANGFLRHSFDDNTLKLMIIEVLESGGEEERDEFDPKPFVPGRRPAPRKKVTPKSEFLAIRVKPKTKEEIKKYMCAGRRSFYLRQFLKEGFEKFKVEQDRERAIAKEKYEREQAEWKAELKRKGLA